MKDNLGQMMRRPRQYWFADGLPEIAIGIIFLATGLLLSMPPPYSSLSKVYLK